LIKLGLKISIKKHPKEDFKLYKKIEAELGRNISLAPSNIPFAFWIQNQNYLIGPPSTSFYDALMLGILPISTSEINSSRKLLITDMYEDFNPLMGNIFKPKSIDELIRFVQENDPKVYKRLVSNPELINILELEVNYPNHIRSLSEFCGVIEKLLIHHKKSLLQNCAIHYFFLYCNFYLESSGMWFSPNKTCIDHFYSFKSLDMFKTKC
jgi:hypothetical protein